MKGRLRAIAVMVVALFAWPLARAPSDAQTTSALRVEVSGAPQRVEGSDGHEHIEYDLIITDAFAADATLGSLEVLSDGRLITSLSGTALGAATLEIGTFRPTGGRIQNGSTVLVPVDVTLRRSVGRAVPAVLTNQVSYAIPADAPTRAVIGATTVDVPPVRVDRRAPIVIAPPLRGTGWWNANGCCDDPAAGHRRAILATSSGGYITPEMFAVDWARVVDGRLFNGDGSKNTDYPTFGAPIYAVADGTVVSVVDNKPDIPPLSHNPGLTTPRDFGGNSVFLRLGPHLFACYAHMKSGSVVVWAGERVRVGQQLGLVGNSGNSSGPHLHFGIQRQPECLSENEPFELNRYTQEGTVDRATTTFPDVRVMGPARPEDHSYPLIESVSTFFGPAVPPSGLGAADHAATTPRVSRGAIATHTLRTGL